MAIWQSLIAKYSLAIGVHELLNACWWFGDTLSLNRNDRVSSFYWTRGSKLCSLTHFSYFSCSFLILVFLRNRYSLIVSHLFPLHSNPISHPVFLYLWHSKVVRHTCAPIFLAQNVWVSQSKMLMGTWKQTHYRWFFPFPPFAEGFWCTRPLGERESCLFYSQKSSSSTFLHDISPTKLRSTARVRHPQGNSKLVNKVDCCLSYDSFWVIPKRNLHLITSQWVPCASLKAIVRPFLATKSFTAGSST